MKRICLLLAMFFLSFVIAGCSSEKTEAQKPSAMSGDKIVIPGSGLSFELPETEWGTEPSNHQPQNSMELFSFTRNEPVLFKNNQAYFPVLSIIVEEIPDPIDAKSYDEYVRGFVEQAGMRIETIESLPPNGGVLPPINGIGWKTLNHTKQGDSMGYLINIVVHKTGIRFILESSPENFEAIDSEFVEIIKSINIDE